VAPGGQTNLLLQASASDPDGVLVDVEFFQNGLSLGRKTTPPFQFASSNLSIGNYQFTAIATDHQSLTATSAPVNVTLYVDSGPPTAEILLPADSTEVTATTNIIGTAYSPILNYYEIQFRLTANETSDEPWITMLSGSNVVQAGVLGQFDPTLLLNGTYQVRLLAFDRKGRGSVTPTTTWVVDRNLKIGNFRISFKDLMVPLSGIPIEVIRTYDSRDKRKGDFGIGWTMEINNVRLQQNRHISKNWYQESSGGLLPRYFLDPVKNRRITVTLSDTKVFKFDLEMNPKQQFGIPISAGIVQFKPTSDTRAKLVSIDGDDVSIVGSVPGFQDLYNLSTGTFYDPELFKMTTDEGDQYIIHKTKGLVQLSDRNSNSLIITNSGIIHSSGASITYTRDAQGRITAITDPAGNSLQYRYDTNGNLFEFVDRVNNTNAFTYYPNHHLKDIIDARGIRAARSEYDDSGRLVRQIDASGKTNTFNFDIGNKRETLVDRMENITIQEYDAHGNILKTTDPLGNIFIREYDGNDNETVNIDPLGHTNQYFFDSQDNKVLEIDSLGITNRWTYNTFRSVSSHINGRGYMTTNEFDEVGNLIRQRDPFGELTSFLYDEKSNLLLQSGPLGNSVENNYDEFGRHTKLLIRDENFGVLKVSTFSFDANGNKTNQTTWRTLSDTNVDPIYETLITTYIFDSESRLIVTLHPDGSTNKSTYNAAGRVETLTDALGHHTTYEYDDRLNYAGTIFPDGSTEVVAYDAENRKKSLKDRAGRLTSYAVDPMGRLTNIVFPDGSNSNIVYDAVGRIISTKDERGKVVNFSFDPDCGCSGGQTAVTNSLGEVIINHYDKNHNLERIVDAAGVVSEFVYDSKDRRVALLLGDGTQVTHVFDALDRQIAQVDQNSNSTFYVYDALGRIRYVTNAIGGITSFQYDELSNLISQKDANNHITRFQHDQMGRRTQRTLPLGMSEKLSYDRVGNLISRTDFNGFTTIFRYDLMNRLVQKSPDPRRGESQILLSYNQSSLRTNMMDASGLTEYKYDMRDRLTQKATPQGTLIYTYDAAGNVISVRSLNTNGVSIAYHWDAVNRLTNVVDHRLGATVYSYDVSGDLKTVVYPNGLKTTFGYNTLKWKTNTLITGSSGSILASYRYQLLPTGQRFSATEGSGRIVDYKYDGVYRLIQERISGVPLSGQISYTHDAVGNRLTRSSNVPGVLSEDLSYDFNDRLSNNAYDNNGNIIGSSKGEDRYDFENRLISRNNGQVNILYDGDGNRVREEISGTFTYYLVDDRNPTGYPQVIEELRKNVAEQDFIIPAVERVYTYGMNLIAQTCLVQNEQNESFWKSRFYGHDGHGSTRFLTDDDGVITDTYEYDAFGILISNSGFSSNKYLYAGEQFDETLGLYYNRSRYLDTFTGRFWSMDGFEGTPLYPETFHKYLYAHGDPVLNVDPSGFCIPWLNGIVVHLRIGADFSNGGTRFSNRTIATLHGLSGPRGDLKQLFLLLRPDLVDIGSKEVFEIKPIWSVGDGFAQLAAYIWLLNLWDPTLGTPGFKPWTPGSGYHAANLNPITGFPANCNNYVQPTFAGVIPYIPVPGSATIAGAVSGAYLWRIVTTTRILQMASIKTLVGTRIMTPGLAF